MTQSTTGQIFVAGQTNAYGLKTPAPLTAGGPFVASVGATGTVDWLHVLPYDDGSPLALDPRADAGPVVIGGGAAATHYDAAGNVALTVGYVAASTPYPNVTTYVAVTSDGRFIVANGQSVRAFGGSGGEQWALALPANSTATLLVADRDGGFWLGGSFVGAFILSRPPEQDLGGTGGWFLLHLDRDGAQIGGTIFRTATLNDAITFTSAVAWADPSGTTSLVVAGTYQGPVSDLMLPAPNGIMSSMVVAVDASGGTVWVHALTSTPFLVPEAAGTLLVLTPQWSAPPDPTEIGIVAARWDASGQEIGSTTLALSSLYTNWIVGPAAGGAGAIVAGAAGATCPSKRHFLFEVGADLQFKELPFNLDQRPGRPGGGP